MPRTFHPLRATSQGNSGLWQLWEGYTLLAQLFRVGRGWWKPRGHPGVNTTPPAVFWRGLPRALALLPTGWAACRQEGGRRGPGQGAQRLGWMMGEWMLCTPPRQPSSAEHLPQAPAHEAELGSRPPAGSAEKTKSSFTELQTILSWKGSHKDHWVTCSTRPAPDGFAPRR